METEKNQNTNFDSTESDCIYSKVAVPVHVLDAIIVGGICTIALLVLINL